ncbi:Isotrichodermin C-15 hydroxylase [Lasiodiplodia hormozganensis]|uniref:Isotrichodermin C-15 hydroxylase n=1 Tax=Lasiodiplodia hormozganensis TaxID=869390 RepID=A0AA39X650_9PEZI|nr:Isotrichodermin C-15 hydroxylase [Lasiodiplodia hormozganensis]
MTPNELSYTDPKAWKDIYGHRNGIPENEKDASQNFDADKAHPSIIHADKEMHSKMRRLLANAFSDKSLREQEPVIKQYVQVLIRRLREQAEAGNTVDMVKWYNYTTFDVIGHLALAESFDCLQNSDYHPWVSAIGAAIKFGGYARAINRVWSQGGPMVQKLLATFIPRPVQEKRARGLHLTQEKLDRRRANDPPYTDLLTNFLKAEREGTLHPRDVDSNGPVIVIAGSETTATLLSGATYYLLTHPDVYKKLVHEVRSAFTSADEITLSRVNALPYMLACLDETFRVYPPSMNSHPRRTPPQGATILGQHIPGGSLLGMSHYATHRSPLNFAEPDKFIPERFIDTEDPRWANDKREALQPFNYGPRNCIGRNLAYIEMRIVIAQVLYHFDLELMPESKNWLDQKVYLVWEKNPLFVRLKPVA